MRATVLDELVSTKFIQSSTVFFSCSMFSNMDQMYISCNAGSIYDIWIHQGTAHLSSGMPIMTFALSLRHAH